MPGTVLNALCILTHLTLEKSYDYCTIIIAILQINKLRNGEADLPKVTQSK